ncbi:MAG: hypothetical protein SGILL_002209 [Bacillariaceae sp.]
MIRSAKNISAATMVMVDDTDSDSKEEAADSQNHNTTSSSSSSISKVSKNSNNTTSSPISAAQAAAAVPAVPHWVPQPHWSIAPGERDGNNIDPDLTSPECYDGLTRFFQETYSGNYQSTIRLALMTEASSHPAGLPAVYGQPWVYAGGGLGNMDECPSQVCLAGGTGRDSLTFASVCTIPECDASDLLAEDFVAHLEVASYTANGDVAVDANVVSLVEEYITLHGRIAEVGKFLGTGWVCGEYKVDWQILPSMIWGGFLMLCVALSLCGTFALPFKRRRIGTRQSTSTPSTKKDDATDSDTEMNTTLDRLETATDFSDSDNDGNDDGDNRRYNNANSNSTEVSNTPAKSNQSSSSSEFWSAWDMGQHLRQLIQHRPETACLDGLKVGSLLWIISSHVMAIESSTAAGYLNPKDFLPPDGITTTFLGQLLFSSRFAVDTFLCISGYLAVYILQRKLKPSSTSKWHILGVLVMRLVRILPLYMFCLGFWMFIAPHLGAGPFWYQWENLLAPCRDSWWTNLLFVNNFLPWGVSTTANCFYHSWYLAVDVQLFFLFAPWLALLFQRSPLSARQVTLFLWISSVIVTAVLSYTSKWSVNTFDGASVALFDVEGYAKPHVRAQSYLAGILVAIWPKRSSRRNHRSSSIPQQSQTIWQSLGSDTYLMGAALSCLFTLSFVTVTGAYQRRACTFEELPATHDCGSLWSPTATFIYTAFSRALWSVCIAIIMAICLEREDKVKDDEDSSYNHTAPHKNPEDAVKSVLSWNIWTPLAHLSFGAYLIHPIVIFIWKLGGREKSTFRLISFFMDFCSITVVTYILSFFVALLVEFPFRSLLHPQSPLLKGLVPWRSLSKPKENQEISVLLPSTKSSQQYGTQQTIA